MVATHHKDGGRNSAAAFRRIVVLDGATLDPGDNPWDAVAALGPLTVHARTPPGLVVERCRGADAILTNKTVLDEEILGQLPEARVIAVLATGVNVVDVAAAARGGITTCNVPDYSAASVAQHVVALVLEWTNAVGLHAAAVRDDEWARARDFSFWKRPLRELDGLTIGLVGHGSIGERVGRIAHALGMNVLACTPSRRNPPGYDGFSWADLATLFAESDVVSLHCPLTAQNHRFVGADLLGRMRAGSLLVNAARGALVDEAALVAALDRGRPAGAALDVLEAEPPPPDHPLVAHPRCLVTPHVGWATLAARRRLMQVTAANLRAFAAGRPQNVVMAAASPPPRQRGEGAAPR